MDSVKIAVLAVSVAPNCVLTRYGNSLSFVKDMLNKSNKNPELNFTVDSFDVTSSKYPARVSEYDVYIIPGSKHSVYDNLIWIQKLTQFCRQVVLENKKLVGFCFGHQIIAQAFGGVVIQNPFGWELGWKQITLTKEGALLLNSKKEKLAIYQIHKDYLVSPPPGFINLAKSDVCPYHSLMYKNQILTIQGHPEYTKGIIKEYIDFYIKANKLGELTNEQKTKIFKDLETEKDDGELFGEALIKFIGAM